MSAKLTALLSFTFWSCLTLSPSAMSIIIAILLTRPERLSNWVRVTQPVQGNTRLQEPYTRGDPEQEGESS